MKNYFKDLALLEYDPVYIQAIRHNKELYLYHTMSLTHTFVSKEKFEFILDLMWKAHSYGVLMRSLDELKYKVNLVKRFNEKFIDNRSPEFYQALEEIEHEFSRINEAKLPPLECTYEEDFEKLWNEEPVKLNFFEVWKDKKY